MFWLKPEKTPPPTSSTPATSNAPDSSNPPEASPADPTPANDDDSRAQAADQPAAEQSDALDAAPADAEAAAAAQSQTAEDGSEPTEKRAPAGEPGAAPDADGGDPFLWLEQIDGEEALNWVRGENERSTAVLEASPHFTGFLDAARAIVHDRDRIPAPSLVGAEVRNFWRDEKYVRGLWRRASLKSYLNGAPEWRTILDVDLLAKAEDENWVFAGVTTLAPDQDSAMVALSRGGADAAVRREFRVSAGAFVKDGFELPEAKGSVAWADKDTLLVALAYGAGQATVSGYPRTVRRLKRGASLYGAPVVFEARESDIGVWPATIVRGRRAYHFITRAITFFDAEHYLLDKKGAPQRLPLPQKSEIEGVLDGWVIASLQEDWRHGGVRLQKGDVVALDPYKDKIELVFRPNERQAVAGVAAGAKALFVELLDNVVGRVVTITRGRGGWREEAIDLPGVGEASLGGVNATGKDAFVYFDSPTTPSTLYYIAPGGARRRVRQAPQMFNTGGVVVRQHMATSTDGEKVPYFVIGRESALTNGRAPVIQYGYGGFEVPTTPGYSGVLGKLWLERGGVYVIANIRGGGEFGPRWHQAALGPNRQRAFDDFFAVSEDLINRGIASPERLGAYGGSNGGLLMGVALTQRPDLYGALAIGVPLLDMMRYHKLLAGPSWIGEYGDPDDPAMADVLRAYSPYHNVREDADYPQPFFFTSTRDDRVHPGHARKMAARLRAAGHDFLYYENIEGGHGAAANLEQAAYRAALQYAYFWERLGEREPPSDEPVQEQWEPS